MKRIAFIAGIAFATAAAAAGMKSAANLARRGEYAAARREAAADTARLEGRSLREALLFLAGLETDEGRAERLYHRVLASAPSREAAAAAVELAKIAYARGEYSRALELLVGDRGERSAEASDEAAYFRGLSRKQLGDRAKARAELARVHRGDYGAWSLVTLAEIEMEEGRLSEAIALFERASSTSVRPVARFGLGECYERSGAADRALETYRAIARESPRSLEAARAAEKVTLLSRAKDAPPREHAGGGGERGAARGGSGTPTPAADRYTIQFGAFGSRANALAAARRIEGVVAAVRVESVEIEGRVWHRVRAGVYESKAQAERDCARVLESLGVSGAVVPLK